MSLDTLYTAKVPKFCPAQLDSRATAALLGKAALYFRNAPLPSSETATVMMSIVRRRLQLR